MKKHVRQFHKHVRSFPHSGSDPKSSLDNDVNMEIEETITYPCKKCESCFGTRNELNKHNAAVHHNEKKLFKCVTCSLTFTEKKLLGEHYTSAHEVHEESNQSICKCKFCPEFVEKIYMNEHVLVNHSIKCNFCPKKFTELKYVILHVTKAHPKSKIEDGCKSKTDLNS